MLLRNDGGGTFTKITLTGTGKSSHGVAWGDYDNDGDLDALVANGGTEDEVLLRNDGSGTLTNIVLTGTAFNSFGVAWGDYDNDGDLDAIVTNANYEDEVLLRNDGGGTLTKIVLTGTGGDSGGVASGDYDNDGDLDAIVGNGVADDSFLLRNDGGGTLTKIALAGTAGNPLGVAWGDYDNDGDLDAIAASFSSSKEDFLLRNDSGTVNAPPAPPEGLGFLFNYDALSSTLTAAWAALDYDANNSSATLSYALAVATAPMTLSGDKLRIVSPASFTVTWGMGSPLMGNYLRPAYKVWPGDLGAKHGLQFRLDPQGILGANFKSDATYYFRLQSMDVGLARSTWSVELSSYIYKNLPPGGRDSFGISASFIGVGYSTVGASAYLIEASTASDFSGTVHLASTTSQTSGNISAGPLFPNTTYYLRLGSLWQRTTSYAPSIPASTATLAEAPALAAVSFTEVQLGSATVQWGRNGNPVDVTTYTVILTTGAYPNAFAGNAQLSTAPAGASPAATLAGLAANTTYWLYARTLNHNGVPTADAFLGSAPTRAAEPVTAASTFTALTNAALSAQWSANGNSAGTLYEAWVSTDTAFAVTHSGNVSVSTRPQGQPAADLTGLAANTTYHLFVRAVSHSGASTAYAFLGSTPTLANPVAAASSPFFQVHRSSAWASWDNNGNALAKITYSVVMSTDSAYPNSHAGNVALSTVPVGSPPSAMVVGLFSDTSYYLHVAAQNAAGALTAYNWVGSTITRAAEPSAALQIYPQVHPTSMTIAWGTNTNGPGSRYEMTLTTGNYIPNTHAGNTVVFTPPGASISSATLTGLSANTTYSLYGRTFDRYGNFTDFVGLNSTATLAADPAAASPAFPELAATTLSASWGAGGNALSVTTYTVEASTAADFSATASPYQVSLSTLPDAGPAASLTGLLANTTYHLRVRAVNHNGLFSQYLAIGSTSTLAASPGAFTSFIRVEIDSATLQWGSSGNPPALTTYTVVMSTDSFYPNTHGGTVALSTVPSGVNPVATMTGISPNTSYYLFVRAINNNGVGTSFVLLGTTATRAAVPVGPASFGAMGVSSFTASWGAGGNALSITTYTVEASSSSQFGGGALVFSVSTVPSAGPAATFSSLLANTTYHLRALAFNHPGVGSALAGLGSTSTLAEAPTAAAVTFSEVFVGSASVSWEENGNPVDRTTYAVVLSTSPGYPNGDAGNAALSTAPAGSLPSAHLSGLAANTTYFLFLQAVNNNGIGSAYFSPGSTATKPVEPLSASSTFTAVANVSLTAQWESGGNGSGTLYEAWASTEAPLTTTHVGNSFVSTRSWAAPISAQLVGLVANTTYFLFVRAVGHSGAATPYVGLGSTATLANTPVAAGVPFSDVSTGSLVGYWNANGNGAGTRYETVVGTAFPYTAGDTGNIRITTAPEGAPAGAFMDLLANASYYLYAAAFNRAGVPTPYASLGSTLTLVKVPAVSTPAFAGTSFDSLTAQWSHGGNSSGTLYNAVVSTETPLTLGHAGNVMVSTAPEGGPQALFAGLSPNATYFNFVRAVGRDGTLTAYLLMGERATDAAQPSAPAAPVSTVSASGLSLSWGAAGNPLSRTTYTVEASTAADFTAGGSPYLVSLDTAPGAGPAAALGGLSVNTTYHLRVRGLSHNGNTSPWTGLGSTSTLAAVPGSAAAAFLSVHAASMSVAWTANGSPVDQTTYTVVLTTGMDYPNALSGNVLVTTAPAGTSLQATPAGLSANTTYYLFVNGINRIGVGSVYAALGSTLTAADTPTPPGAGASTFTVVGISSIAVRWGAGSNPAGTEYQAEVSTSASFGGGAMVGVSGWITSTSTVFAGLSTNSVVHVRVKARNAAGTESSFAAMGSTTTLAEPPSAAASVFPLVGVSSIQAQWQSGGNPASTEYELQASTEAGFLVYAASGTWAASTSAFAAALAGDATYYLRVRARNSAGVSTEFLALGSTATLAAEPSDGLLAEAGPYGLLAAWSVGGNRRPQSGAWTASVSALPAARSGHAVAVYGGRIYVSGGTDGSLTRSSVYFAPLGADGSVGAFRQAESLPASRESHAMAAWGGRLYVIAGFDGSPKSTAWWAPVLLDGSLGAWTETTSLPSARHRHAALAWQGRLFVSGGENSISAQSTVYQADIQADGTLGAWSTGAALPAARSGHAMAVSSGALYVAGGVGAGVESTVWRAPLVGNSPSAWSIASPLPEGRTRFSLVPAGGRLFALGGHDGSNARATVYASSLKADGTLEAWTQEAPLPGARTLHGAGAFNDRLILAGGDDGTGPVASVGAASLQGTLYSAELARDSGFTLMEATRALNSDHSEFPGLAPNAAYYARVKTVGMDGRSSAYFLLGSTLTPAALPGSAISTFTASSTGSLSAAWGLGDNPAGTEFQASLSTSAGGGGAVIIGSWSSSLSNGFAGLAPNTSYYLRVQARNSAGLAGSYVLAGATHTLAAAPGGSVFQSVQTTGFTLEWSAGGNPAGTRYEAQVATTASFGNVNASSVTLSTSASFSGLLSAATFYARVRAYNGNGTATAFDTAVSTFTGLDTVAPSSATQASAHPSGSANAVEVYWTASGDDGTAGDLVTGSRYFIQWTTSAPQGGEVVWSTSNAQVAGSTGPVSAGSAVSVIIGGLPSLKTAFLKVWSRDESDNYSAPSDTISVFVSPFVLGTLDGSGIDAGSYASLAPERSGDLHAAYTGGFGTQELRYLKRVSGNWGSVEFPDPGVGASHAVVAVDGDSRPKILYRGPSGELKLAGKSGTWSSETLESGDLIPGGAAVDPVGVQASYYDAAAKDLKHARWNGLSWSTNTVDTAGDVGRYSSLAIDSSGTPHIAYYDATNADLKYARWTGAAWSVETVDGTGVDVGSAPALALDGSGWARIAYADTTNMDVKFASKSSGGWTLQTVDGPGSMGNVGGLALDGSGKAAISYSDLGSQDLKAALWTGGSWSTMTVDSRGGKGEYSGPVIEPFGSMTVVYKDSSNDDLKSASWSAGLPTPIGGRGPLSGPTAFAGTAISSGAIQWNWTDNAGNEQGFELYGAAAATGPYTLLAGGIAAAPGVGTLKTYTESGLSENTTYYRFVSVIGVGGSAWSKAASAYPFSTADRSSPTVTDNQAGDDVWRKANAGIYDIDIADLGGSGLSRFSVKVSTRSGGLGPDLTGFVDVVVNIGSDTYSSDWSLPPAVFDAIPDGATAYATVRAEDGVGNSTVLTDAFWVRKDTSPPSLVDNQTGDTSLRITSGTFYDVDAFDGGGGLERMQYSASLTAASADAAVVNWTDIPLTVGATFFSSDWPLDFASLASASTNYISIRAWDRAGSTTTLIDAFFVLKDAAGPQVRILAPASSYRSSLAAISGTAADPSGIQGVELKIQQSPPGGLYWNGTGFSSAGELWFTAQGTSAWSFAPGSAWVDGTSYQAVARSSDAFGNYAGSYATAAFTMDMSTPTAGVVVPVPDTTISSLAQITGTSSDAGSAVSGVSAVEVRLKRLSDGLWWNFASESWSLSAVSTIPAGTNPWSLAPTERLQAELAHQASYFIGVRAQDNAAPANAGDFFAKGSTFTFSDTAPPAAVANLSALTGASPGQIQLSWSAPGDDGSSGMTLLGEYRIHYTTISGVAFDTVSAQVAFSTAQVRPGEAQGRLLSGLIAGGTYFIRTFMADDAGNWSALSNGATAMAAPQPLSRISGHVMKVSSEGITAVLLECYDESNALRGTAFTLADGSGTYVVDGLPSGSYKVQASWTAGDITSSVWLDGIPVGSYDIDFVLQINYTLSTLTGTLQSLSVAGARGAVGSDKGHGVRAAASGAAAFLARAQSDHYSTSTVELYQGGKKAVSVAVAPSGRWEISNLLPGKYGVRAFNGLEYTDVQDVEVGEGEVKEVSFVYDPLPTDSVFAFPNPARTRTTIRFVSTLIPLEAQVSIFDIAGNLVRELAGSQMSSPAPGLYHAVWDLDNDRGEAVASGVYLFMVKVKGGPESQSAKVVKKLAIVR